MSGEWDVLYEFYGPYSWIEPITDILTSTQEGATFIAVKQIGSRFIPKGGETIKGELDENGFKTVYLNTANAGWVPCKWEISENGNKIVIDTGDGHKSTLTRR